MPTPVVQITDKIYDTVKSMAGPNVADDSFDVDLVVFTNATLVRLYQLGIGTAGFQIVDGSETWSDLMGTDPRFNLVQNYVYDCVRLKFDPPSNSSILKALQEDKAEMEETILYAVTDARIHPMN